MMTTDYITYTAFALVCLTLLTLPFIPAFSEWLKPTDTAALPISPHYTSETDHFAKRLHSDAMAKLGLGESTGYEEFDLVPSPAQDMDWSMARRRLISRGSIDASEPIRSAQPVYVQGHLRAGAKSAFAALYATGDIELGAGSEVHDWAHADGVLRLGDNSAALRRISAGIAIELGNEAWFERLQAPTLHFGLGSVGVSPQPQAKQLESSFADLQNAIQQTPLLFLVRGDCALPSDRIYRGSLVVTGFLTVGPGTTVCGDLKARLGVSIGHQASVEGAVTCEKRVYVFKDARVFGPVVAESDILIGSNAVIGLPESQTTVSACNIIVEDGVVVHGAVWAHEIGMVKSA